MESELQSILDRVKTARKADPHFESAIRAFADAEASLGSEDPAEGRKQPSRGSARKWQARTMEGLDVPNPHYVGRYRGEKEYGRIRGPSLGTAPLRPSVIARAVLLGGLDCEPFDPPPAVVKSVT